MEYIVTREELEKLAKGEMPVEEIAKLENMTLYKWRGNDVIGVLDNVECEQPITTEEEENIIKRVSELMENDNIDDEITTLTKQALNEIRNIQE